MLSDADGREAVRRNLEDAGCPGDMIERFMACDCDGCSPERRRLLARQRCALLDGLHEDQRRLDCLDYLIFRLRQDEERPGGAGK